MNASEQVDAAYRTMATEVRYRPEAPSDGFGNITGALDLVAESESYAANWFTEESGCEFSIGCPDFRRRKALIYTIEAARLVCGALDSGDVERARKLLALADSELRRGEAR